ncbi:MAG: DUF4837 family protein [Bacteroidales bacterium]|nr:DUF4837 family protein [Bacteroidales bacterium]
MLDFKKLIIQAAAAMAVLSGCNNTEKILPSISGKAGEVAVVCSKVEWEGEPGSTLRTLLSDEVPYLPQVEPMYDFFNVPQQAFHKVFRVHRNIIVIDSDEKYTEPSLSTFNDVWAAPQTVIRVAAADGKQAAAVIAAKGDKILATLATAERNRLITNIKEFENAELRNTVNHMVGGSPIFPKGYTVKKATDNFIWISCETTYTIQSVLIWKYPYTGEGDLTPEALAAKRNEITKEQIPCTMEGSYMILNPDIFPGSAAYDLKGRSIVELRGLWEAYNDFMGGPFTSQSFLTPDNQNIVTMDAFVYAPKYDKRNYLRQLEAILYSFDWNNLAVGE